MGPFYDKYTSKLKEAYDLWGKKKTHEYVTALFRQYQPEVVVTHDTGGEYGHGAHRLCADTVKACIEKAADNTIYETSAEKYGAWQVKKAYHHLSEENPITMNWDLPLASHGGKTGFQVAEDAYGQHLSQHRYRFTVEPKDSKHSCYNFGLFFSTVGSDIAKNDFLENIPQ